MVAATVDGSEPSQIPELEESLLTYRHIVMQATTRCNLNCTYCYLPNRRERERMSPEVAQLVANSINTQQIPVTLLWHLGEPTATGLPHFKTLLEPFRSLRAEGLVRHNMQTNATLIGDNWAELFTEEGFHIGVSLDGDSWANVHRVNWAGGQSFERACAGIAVLRRHGIPVNVLTVVTDRNVDRPEKLYAFIASLGARSLSLNAMEVDGINKTALATQPIQIRDFWRRLFHAWNNDPCMSVREIELSLRWLRDRRDAPTAQVVRSRDLFPSVSWDGRVVLLSPEFLAGSTEDLRRFVVGSVKESSLHDLVKWGCERHYVRAFLLGISACAKQCSYFDFCRGGQASNKYFELGTTYGTETQYCRNIRQALLDGVLLALQDQRAA